MCLIDLMGRVGRDFLKWWHWLASLDLRTPLGRVALPHNVRSLGCVTAVRRVFIVFAERQNFKAVRLSWNLKFKASWSSWFQKYPVCQFWPINVGFIIKLNCLAEMGQCEDLLVCLIKTHIYGSKLPKGLFFISVGSGDFVSLISAQSDNFEFLTLYSAWQKL